MKSRNLALAMGAFAALVAANLTARRLDAALFPPRYELKIYKGGPGSADEDLATWAKEGWRPMGNIGGVPVMGRPARRAAVEANPFADLSQ